MSERNVCEVWLTDELQKWSSRLLDNLSNCLICAPGKFSDRPASVRIISVIHLSTHFTSISFTNHSFHRNTIAQQIDLLTSEWLHSSIGKSTALPLQRSWVQIPWKISENFQVHTWDNCWYYPASVRIISATQMDNTEQSSTPFEHNEKWLTMPHWELSHPMQTKDCYTEQEKWTPQCMQRQG